MDNQSTKVDKESLLDLKHMIAEECKKHTYDFSQQEPRYVSTTELLQQYVESHEIK